MSITVNGQSRVPPGFRFHPTEEELLNYYLRKKLASETVDMDVIRDVDLNKLEPWDIQEKCRIGSTPQNDWYFFSHKDKKYPTGTRTNRATAAGFWKATGRDKVIHTSFKRIGMRKTLVFYGGRAPHGLKSDWIMHEYRLDESPEADFQYSNSLGMGDFASQEEGWVVCRVFKKKNYHKASDIAHNSSSVGGGFDVGHGKTQVQQYSSNDSALDQILQYMGRSCKQEKEANAMSNLCPAHPLRYQMLLPPVVETSASAALLDRFMKLPALENPLEVPCRCQGRSHVFNTERTGASQESTEPCLRDWASVDRLVASHLNGQAEASAEMECFEDPTSYPFCSAANDIESSSGCGEDMDLWAFARSASSSGSDHLFQESNTSSD